jgi:hypothetical protein
VIQKLMQMSVDWRHNLGGLFLVMLIAGVYFDLFAGEEAAAVKATEPLTTIVPKDFDLVVLDLKNSESVDILMGDFAFVSLYQENQKVPLVTGLKIFRAPKNPEKFVALIPKLEVSDFVLKNQQLTAVIAPGSSETGTVFVTKNKQTQRTILIGTEAR